MAFYSALILAANKDMRGVSENAIWSLLNHLGILSRESSDVVCGNLAKDIGDHFEDQDARRENSYFFSPDSVSVHESIEVHAPDVEEFLGTGWCVNIHGNGYLFPWDIPTLRKRLLQSPKLMRLRQAMTEQFGGRFSFPWRKRWLRGRAVDENDGWVWLMSESV